VSHSPDQVFVAPVFAEGKLSAFAQSWAHFNDIGGMRAGSLSPDCTEIYQEGIIVPPVRVAREGVICDELLRLFYRNSRFPEMVKGDTRASMAAIRLGERRLGELFERFGRARTTDAFERLIAETEQELRGKLRAIVPEGSHAFTDTIDSDGQGHGPIKLRYRLDVTGDRIVLDTSASDDQVPGPVNFLMSPQVPSMVFGSYLLGEGSEAILNAGVEKAIDEVIVREGSVLQPRFPAPLGMRGVTMMRNMATCLGLLNVATRGRAMAAHSAYVIWYLRGRDGNGELFLLSDGLGVGYGARPTADGNDAVYLVAQENFPSEFLDSVFPVRVLRYAINPDTGGPGRWRGGCGLIREIEVLAPEATISMRIDSVEHPPWGVAGGHAAGTGRCVVNPGRSDERILRPLSDGNVVKRGDVVRIETGGGGGWGLPFDREPERVLTDVRGGFVSGASAEAHYGVVLTADGPAVDPKATAARRARRPEAKLFHRHGYHEVLA
jgi:N-methylhydantoinase B